MSQRTRQYQLLCSNANALIRTITFQPTTTVTTFASLTGAPSYKLRNRQATESVCSPRTFVISTEVTSTVSSPCSALCTPSATSHTAFGTCACPSQGANTSSTAMSSVTAFATTSLTALQLIVSTINATLYSTITHYGSSYVTATSLVYPGTTIIFSTTYVTVYRTVATGIQTVFVTQTSTYNSLAATTATLVVSATSVRHAIETFVKRLRLYTLRIPYSQLTNL